ncbi:MAG TPA: inactive serine/threonine-protein kinase VRK3, partial [Ktedonobacteraceae bacterium]|nr:inactive serine/threonine-protein kinase VRK3 [Ktedonobacteraceae bacterium]
MTLFPPVNAGIKCPKCSYINRDTARFCGVCGISLTSFRSLSEGTIIGSYVIVKRLGVGGIGAVYLSRHRILEHLVVAIKIHDYFPEDKQVGIAFKQSANYLSQMRHSSIVQLLDYGFQNDHAYQAMEYIEGPTFASLVPDQPTKGWLNQCLEYFAQL